MIDIRKNRLNEIEIEVSKNSTIHNWLSDQAYFRRNDCWQHLFYETENTFIYCVSRKLFKEFVSWAFQGEQVHDCDLKWDSKDDQKLQRFFTRCRRQRTWTIFNVYV